VALAQALTKLKAEQVTVVVITHRKNILNVVDNLLVMKDGQVVAYGEKNQVLQSLTAGQSQQPPTVSVPVIKPASA
jgi:ATP-binding cassette, subfamily C, type I secretion system permease/ATPase